MLVFTSICIAWLHADVSLAFSSQFNPIQRLREVTKSSSSIESELLKVLETETIGRGAKTSPDVLKYIENSISQLENTGNGIKSPTRSTVLEGCWKLMYTSSPGTNSPIQRTFTAVDDISIYQVVNLFNSQTSLLSTGEPDVSNVVCFGDKSRLRITALASTVQTFHKLAAPWHSTFMHDICLNRPINSWLCHAREMGKYSA